MQSVKNFIKMMRGDHLFKKVTTAISQMRSEQQEASQSINDEIENLRNVIGGHDKQFHIIKSDITRLLKIRKNNRANFQPIINKTNIQEEEYKSIKFGYFGLQVLVDYFDFDTVLDVGSGGGDQGLLLSNKGKTVTAIDYGKSIYFEENHLEEVLIGDFNTFEFPSTYDCIWASHVLEHQVSPHHFLKKCFDVLNDDGVLAITVPPMKHEIVGGHLSVWNAGLLMYNLVLAGFDCSQAFVCSYGYNVTVIVRKKPVGKLDLVFDNGDITRISKYLPQEIAHEPFDGDIEIIVPDFMRQKFYVDV